MIILTRHRWLGLAKISGWSRRSCRTRVRLGPTWAEARVMTQSRQIRALSAPLSPSSWLAQVSSSPGAQDVLMCHTERGSGVGVSKLTQGQSRA